MFGTLKPHTCHLGCDRQHEYGSFYCGLCKSLGDNFGTLTRGLLNYDAVFLALVADGLVDEGAAPSRCRCPLLPVTFRPTVAPDSPAMRYAAAMQMLLSDQWLADRAMDGRRVAQVARPLLSGKVALARAILADLGISLADLEGFEEHQHRTEILGTTGPREAAEPTASALERVFDRMALLPGVPADGRSPEARAALGAFGRHLGSAIYLIDALDDLEKDHRGGAFNPCLLAGSHVSWHRVELTWGLLRDDLTALGELVSALPLRRHRDLVRNVVASELPRLSRAAAKRAHAHARAESDRAARAHAARRAQAWPLRALTAAATLFVLLWVWLSSIPALAQGRKKPPTAQTAGPRDAGVPPEHWEPRLPAAPTSSAAPPKPAPTPATPATGSPAATPTGKGNGADPGTTPPATPKPGGGAPACTNPCSGCGSGGTSCPCSGCADCCSACKGGDCGCCKVCDSCGSCSNGCNSCCR